ncbi:unnamed protein product [Parnassius apollo]|uniref:(apollo) hypothetical protein n=1 Tax=Parnassius apollo TaxID=110799 RepID=A0A8S3W633_PARAO|nr:unnamed protein product [Parnassius apollo]
MKNKVYPEFINRDIEYVRYKNKEANNESHLEHIYTGFNKHKWLNAKEGTSTKIPLNYFTILSKELADSESLSDKEKGVEKIQCGDVLLESNYWSNNDDNNNSKFKSYYKDLDSNRTILIYSFKNKNMLNEDNITPINISSTDSNSSTSVDCEDLEKVENRSKMKYQYRVPSPTPATYVPRLNLYTAATLPTVTEIAEPYQYITGNTTISFKSEKFLLEENITKTENSNNLKEDICFKESTISATNVINWLALSPRTKRRNLKLPKFIDKNSVIEEGIKNDEKCKLKYNGLWNTLKTNEKTITSTSDQKSDNNNGNTYVKTKDEQTHLKAISSEQEKDELLIDEKGDCNKMKRIMKPCIGINQLIKKELTTDTIEKLNRDNRWIDDKNKHGNKENLYIDDIDSIEHYEKPEEVLRCASDRLFIKNMPKFLPITESVPSLYLPLPSNINEDKQSWSKRIIKCILCCIKCK